ncbi:MAG TPA: alpha/beta hydrolase, partial [Candidatus Acidoferrales bacterium]|nr:alpha/beta hydrolase [Candidatus Acidoferrales bacterium]
HRVGHEDPVIVAHSMAGVLAPIVATRRPVARVVYLSALLPQPGASLAEQRASEPVDGLVPPTVAEWTDHGDGVWAVGPNTARELFFHDASPADAAWAAARLRPQAYVFMNEVTPLAAWPDVPATYIACRDDRAVNPAWGREAAHERLGVTALEIEGGHSPFITRPAELATLLEPLLR